MSVFADALVGQTEPAALKCLLDHFWELRSRARKTFTDARTRDQVARLLTEQVRLRLTVRESDELPLVARQLAESALALVRAWLSGEVVCSSQTLADAVIRSAGLLIDGLLIQ